MCITKQKIGDLAKQAHTPRLQGSKTVAIAIEIMAMHNSALVAIECKDDFVGIFTRDCLTKNVLRQNLVPTETLLYEVMIDDSPAIESDCTVKDAYETMLSCQLEFLPVLEERKLVGIVSIKELAKEVIHSFEEIKIENQMILNYIQGGESYAIANYVFPPHESKTHT